MPESELAEAQRELQDAIDEVTGVPQTVLIDGTSYPCRYDEVTFDEIAIAGGNGEAGGFRCYVAASRFAEQPPQGASVEGKGMELQVLSAILRNDVEWEILCGDLVSQEDADA